MSVIGLQCRLLLRSQAFTEIVPMKSIMSGEMLPCRENGF
jgi:hypothetical protein